MSDEIKSKKRQSKPWAAILFVLVVTLLVGGGVYYWQQVEINTVQTEKDGTIERTKTELQNEIGDLQKQIAQLQSKQAETTETSAEPSQKIIVADEKALGYITKVYDKDGKRYLDIDYIQWLTGEDAKQAMVEDGLCESVADCVVTNDYHIKNQNSKIRTFEISTDTKIYMQTLDIETKGINWDQEITYDIFKGLFATEVIEQQQYIPYHISIKDGIVIEIAEQYIP
ncbi:hypothetical protein KJ903_00035 [Patescibacteria group bacterium]|nr:hypothetical protein [Patescibacteria group bacterium]